ncbi:TetR/AcrR family transcriptional regulator [Paracidobacterium acidisoli]|uniref:TetR/AcrR family transcriptional regulator n=1 Tax=Paracidobacterium acidisoli TaxID=2303751 RepID=A0A372IUW7_9BACT|nr:TetR/AcrR family transcriptional regulator [Paracidobacterium acidisoli]MBT9330059.1 TetR/AcrR family transcriptional regulator [Paracidobacterium acidisoli]
MVRPRSAEAHRKVLEASLELFSERGIDATSMDAIAGASGVSKATIYKHWPDKDRLALEVLSWMLGLDEERPEFNSGDLREDLIDALTWQPAEHRREMKNRIMPHVIAYSARNQEFGKAWRERVVERQREGLSRLLECGVARRRLRGDLSVDLSIALLVGPMVYRNIFVTNRSMDRAPREFVEQVVDAFLAAFGTAAKKIRG